MNMKSIAAFINYPSLSPTLTLHAVLRMVNQWIFFHLWH